MTPSKYAAQIRFRTHTNSTTLTDTDLLRLTNKHKNLICKKAIKSTDEDLFVIPATADLAANQREYSLPADMVSLRRVETSFDGTSWIKLRNLELHHIHAPTNESEIVSMYANVDGLAAYDVMRKSIVIYSGTIIAVSGGLKIWFEIYPADITSFANDDTDLSVNPTTTSFGIPEELQAIIEDAVVIEVKSNKDKPLPLNEREQNFEFNLFQAISDLRNSNRDKAIVATVPNDADATGDHGSEL